MQLFHFSSLLAYLTMPKTFHYVLVQLVHPTILPDHYSITLQYVCIKQEIYNIRQLSHNNTVHISHTPIHRQNFLVQCKNCRCISKPSNLGESLYQPNQLKGIHVQHTNASFNSYMNPLSLLLDHLIQSITYNLLFISQYMQYKPVIIVNKPNKSGRNSTLK